MVQNLYAKAKRGSEREELNSKVRRFHIFKRQTVSVASLREETEATRDELEEWKQNYKDLKSETKRLFEEMYAAIQDREKSLSDLQSKNEEFLNHIEKIESSEKLCGKRHFRSEEEVSNFDSIYVSSQNCLVVYKVLWTRTRIFKSQ